MLNIFLKLLLLGYCKNKFEKSLNQHINCDIKLKTKFDTHYSLILLKKE